MNRRALVLGAIAVGIVRTAQAQQSATERYTIGVGELLHRSSRDVRSYSMSGPEIVELRFAGADFLFVGRMRGTTVILLIFADGHQVRCEITVTAPPDTTN